MLAVEGHAGVTAPALTGGAHRGRVSRETVARVTDGSHGRAGAWGDAPLVSGEAGCAPVAALLALAGRSDLRNALGLGAGSRVPCMGCEGATASAHWASGNGLGPEDVEATATVDYETWGRIPGAWSPAPGRRLGRDGPTVGNPRRMEER